MVRSAGAGVTEMHLRLSYDAVLELSQGEQLVVDVPDTDVRIFLRCSDLAVESFRQAVHRAMLHMLPAEGSTH